VSHYLGKQKITHKRWKNDYFR